MTLGQNPLTGLWAASIIFLLWFSSLVLSLCIDVHQISFSWILLSVLGRTFIHTGLFIITHDAIHGTVAPSHPQLNQVIGRLAITLYACLSYRRLRQNHWLHHHYPGQARDPDFHDGIQSDIVSWYLRFMQTYLKNQTLKIACVIALTFGLLYWGFHIPPQNLVLFWILPLILSSMQLFVFGTFLPHRSSDNLNGHTITSCHYPPFLSFLTCYHFAYHREHHEYPFLPWYQLPLVFQNKDRAKQVKP